MPHSMKLPAIATGMRRSHSQRASCMRLTHHAIAARPTPKVTITWSSPLYSGLTWARYCSRNLRWRSVIMARLFDAGLVSDILVVDQRPVNRAVPFRTTKSDPESPARPAPAAATQEAHDPGNPRLEAHRREDGLHVGARIHGGTLGGDGRCGRRRRR